MAFHSILEHVETLGLAEGEYLSTVNALKKAFQDTNKGKYITTHIPINLSLDYIDGDKQTSVNMTKITRMEYVRKDDGMIKPNKIIYTFNLITPDGKTETMSLAKEEMVFFGFLKHLAHITMCDKFNIRYASGRKEEFTYRDYVRQSKRITEIYDEDYDGDDNPLTHDAFSFRITNIFENVLSWETRKYTAARED